MSRRRSLSSKTAHIRCGSPETGVHRCPASTPANSADVVPNSATTASSGMGWPEDTERMCWFDLEA